MSEWRRRLAERAPGDQVVRIEWYQRRHHCYDPKGAPMAVPDQSKAKQYWESLMANADPNTVLDKVVALWNEAGDHEQEAQLLEEESRNQRKMAEDLYEQAENLWKPLLDDHPEWRDDLILAEDPRLPKDDEA